MAKRSRSLLALGLGTCALLAAGCGPDDDEGVAISADGVAKPHYLADGDEICADGNRKLEAARKRLARRLETGGESTDAQIESFVEEEVVPIAEERIDALRALEPPAGDEERVAEIYDAAERALERIEAMPRLAERADRVFGRASRLAAEYGFRECARSG